MSRLFKEKRQVRTKVEGIIVAKCFDTLNHVCLLKKESVINVSQMILKIKCIFLWKCSFYTKQRKTFLDHVIKNCPSLAILSCYNKCIWLMLMEVNFLQKIFQFKSMHVSYYYYTGVHFVFPFFNLPLRYL